MGILVKVDGLDPPPEALHPNPCGHQAEAKLLALAYQNPGQTGSPFTPPSLPPAAKITVQSHHGNFPFGCHATFQAVTGSRSSDVASYEWYDKTGNLRGTGESLDMDSVHNDFQLYLRTIGSNGQDRYSFFHSSIC